MRSLLKRVGACLLVFSVLLFPQGTVAAADDWVNWSPGGLELPPSVYEAVREALDGEEEPKKMVILLHDWICENIYYDREALALETYGTLSAAGVIEQRRGVCEAIANLTQSMFLAADIPCVKVWGVAIAPGDDWKTANIDLDRVNHTWNEYYMAGQWFPIDCTMDMGNWYENGEYHTVPCTRAYLAPTTEFFAQTHMKRYQETASEADTPDVWAREELIQAVDAGVVPVTLLADYRAAITGEEFSRLTGCAVEDGVDVTRAAAAVALARRFVPSIEEDREMERIAMDMLYQMGILRGDGVSMCPQRSLTRQEAILLVARMAQWEARICT